MQSIWFCWGEIRLGFVICVRNWIFVRCEGPLSVFINIIKISVKMPFYGSYQIQVKNQHSLCYFLRDWYFPCSYIMIWNLLLTPICKLKVSPGLSLPSCIIRPSICPSVSLSVSLFVCQCVKHSKLKRRDFLNKYPCCGD